MAIGIDFGTTHTIAAVMNGSNTPKFITLDSENKYPHLLRSMLYITKEHEILRGMNAVQTYLSDNTGRIAKLEPKYVGTITNTVARVSRRPLEPDGPITYTQDVYIEEDVAAPGRLIQSIKTGLRDISYEGTNIYGKFYSIQTLIAHLLHHVRQSAEEQLGMPIDEVVLGRPVRFSEQEDVDAYAEKRLAEAAQEAGFKHIRFEQEPIAAALFYTQHLTQPETVLVFDFGGGTLDMTIMQVENGQKKILATQGMLIGGDDFDTAIMLGKVAAYFGSGYTIDREGHPFPEHLINRLARWQTIPELSKADTIPLIRRAQLYGNNPPAFRALETLALKNYGFALFEQVEQAKRNLSDVMETHVLMQAEEIQLDVPLTRREFQMLITDEIVDVSQGIDALLQEAGLLPQAVDVVVTTGGSSLIPAYQMMLRRKLPSAHFAHSDTFGSVAGGLAIRANGS